MIEKTFNNARIVHKGDIEANWKKATGFKPKAKEIIIYLPDENYDYCRMKIGDGNNYINDLPFFGGNIEGLATEEWVTEQGNILVKGLQKYTDDSVQGLATENYVDSSVTGLASEEYVDSSVQGLATETYVNEKIGEIEIPTIPEGLATEEYVNNKVDAIVFPEVDQTYNATSTNAQSGVAVNKALKPINNKNNEQDRKWADLENKAIIATFNITEANVTIKINNFTGTPQIDWGDGTINNLVEHTYTTIKEYTCKIYGISSIGYISFASNKNLTNIIIPDNVAVSVWAFKNCINLTTVIFNSPKSLASVNPTPGSCFEGCSSLTYIYVPYGCSQAYKEKWIENGADQTIIDKIVESDREAYMSDLEAFEVDIDQEYNAESQNAQSGVAVSEALNIFKENNITSIENNITRATTNDILGIF